MLKLIILGGMALALFAVLSLAQGSKPRTVGATSPLPPLLSCPNVDGSSDNKVTAADILAVVKQFGHSYGLAGYNYFPLYDLVSPV